MNRNINKGDNVLKTYPTVDFLLNKNSKTI